MKRGEERNPKRERHTYGGEKFAFLILRRGIESETNERERTNTVVYNPSNSTALLITW